MTTQRALSADTARATALEDCENKIRSAFRRGLEATCAIARELHKIVQGQLYIVKTEDFTEYVTSFLRIDIRSYRRIVAVSQTIAELQEAGLVLPANESQAAELSRLDPSLRAKVWLELVSRAERREEPLTLDDVKHAVEVAESLQSSTSPAPRHSGIEVDMEEPPDNNGSEPAKKSKAAPVQEGELILSEKGEAALNRIRKVCGDPIADAVEDGTVALSEREIRNWAEYDEAMMRSLAYYVIDKRWPLSKAVAFETKALEGSSEVDDLILIASARGGSAIINYDNRAKITVELT